MRANSRLTSVAALAIAVLLCIAFIAAGLAKLFAAPTMVATFNSFGYPPWFMFVTGIIEVASALLVIIPATARIAAVLMTCVMLGAIFAHVTHGQSAMIVAPVLLLVLALAELQLRVGCARRFMERK